jgi:CRISPR/Cas system CMR subunit Cmr6 (Cas7 group RAMP superfamily)
VPDQSRTVPGPPRAPAALSAAGPIGSLVTLAGDQLSTGCGADANALIVLNRLAFLGPRKLEDAGRLALVKWACARKLGQDPELVAAVTTRRDAALAALARRGCHCLRLEAEPEWRLAVGLNSNANAHEIGLALHGTYGWPVIPGSALKGLAAAWAAESGADDADMGRVFGGPRLGTSDIAPGRGSVRFLDAIPSGKPVTVVADVLTPHVKPYYDSMVTGAALVPPAEYHNPVPLMFLTVRGTYAVDLYGDDEAGVALAARWLAEAGDELGAGAKTAAGYGYLSVHTP